MSENMNLTLKIWRQAGPDAKGELKEYKMTDVSPDMSFLEMLDVLNEKLVEQKQEPVVRPRLPRRYLRCVLAGNQRPSPRTCAPRDDLPAPHAQVQGRRYHLHRTVPRKGFPGYQRPDGGPQGIRPHTGCRRFHFRKHKRKSD